jgi:hypothetical protein
MHKRNAGDEEVGRNGHGKMQKMQQMEKKAALDGAIYVMQKFRF